MKPALGDVLINRYTLVYRLRDEPGIQAWRANDRVLARDCQLFLVNDARSVDDAISIASSLALSKSKQFTQVLHLQYWGKVALMVTQLDAGVSLSDYLREPGDDSPLDFDAMASIVADCAAAVYQRSNNEFIHRCVNTDVIRLTVNGIQLADAPVSPLLADASHSPAELGMAQIVTRQLAVVLYEMLTRTPRSRLEDRSWNSLPEHTPAQLRQICERGMTFTDHDIPSAAALTTPEELIALLGDVKAITALDSEHINLPREDAQCSISNVALRTVDPQDLLNFPSTLHAPAATEATASHKSAHQADEGQPGGVLDSAATPPSTSDSGANEASDASDDDQSHKQHWDFHDIAAAQMADILSPAEPNTSDLIFPNSSGSNIFDPSSTHTAHFDFTFPVVPAQEDTGGDDASTGVVTTGSREVPDANTSGNTARIPLFDEHGNPIAPGEESARALQDEQAHSAQSQGATLPPSFIPSATSTAKPEPYAPSTVVPPSSPDEGIANTPVFGSIRTKVVAIVIGTLVVVAALVWALNVLLPDSTGASTENTQGNWPQIDTDEVPFGASPPPADDDDAQEGGNDSQDEDDQTGDTSNADNEADNAAAEPSPTQPQIRHADKVASAVPAPALPESNTPLTFDVHQMITKPSGQEGLSYYLHLSEPHTPYRIVVQNRTSGGTAYVRVNTTGDPNQGEQVAQFSFDASGTTEVKFDRLVETQDLVIWMPFETIPQGGVYFSSIQVF